MQSPLRSPSTVLLLALLLGLAADYLFYGRWVGISAPLFVALGLLALGWLSRAEDRPPTRANLWLGGAALLFAGFMALRDAPALVVFNAMATVGLLLVQTAYFRGAALPQVAVLPALLNLFKASWQIGTSPAVLSVRLARAAPLQRGQVSAVLPVARGVALAMPALLVFGGLLIAADSVFASYVTQLLTLDIPVEIARLANHAIVVLFVAWLCAGGLYVALSLPAQSAATGLPAEGDTERLTLRPEAWRFLGGVEALTVLVLIDALFGAFMLIQGAYFFGGLDTLNRTGMTYASYARRGFFELVTVACLTLGMLWTLALITRRSTARQWRGFKLASGVMAVLVVGMLVSAFQRMWLYEEAYGFTRLRVYTHSFMIWLALVLVLFLVALARDKPKLFVFGGVASALIYLALLNVANPDALIVRANVARYQATGDLDADYLATLSADAMPATVAALDDVDPDAHEVLLEDLRRQQQQIREGLRDSGWPAWSLARARVLAAIASGP